ncbi:MAG: glycosyltransferase family 2 protein [Dehalococcoidia bacterium]|nr:glycosyltransferase family 2 protein [Dehalococcoidia bacterium]
MASDRERPSPPPFLSVVIPAFNEDPRISETLERVTGFLNSRPYSWEVLVADDGSTDGTGRLVGGLAELHPNLHLISLPHRGKGWAVKNAMLAASGQYRFLCDADLSVPIEQVERFLPPQTEGIDIAIGSREAPGARRIGEPNRRHLMGRIFNSLVRFLAVPRLRDTQCGFKCFRGEIVPDLFQRQTMDGFAFDVEVLFLARKAGLTMREIAVDWYYREFSKVRPVRDSLYMTLDLLKIRWRYLKGRYRRPAATERVESKLP